MKCNVSSPVAVVASLLGAILLAVACVPPSPTLTGTERAAAAPRAEKRIVYGVALAIDLRPTAATGPSLPTLTLLGAGLSSPDGQGGHVPRLADQVPSLANGLWTLADSGTMVTTFHLRRGAQWHDGTPITADDFIFSLEVGSDGGVPAFRTQAYGSITQATAPDPLTLRVEWNEPYIWADALFAWDQGYGVPLPRHLLEDAYTTNRDGFLNLPYWDQEFVGSGPFKVASWDPGVGAQLVAHEGYTLGRPRIDRIDMLVIPDRNTLMANILAGTVDVAPNLGSTDAGLQLRDQWQGGRVIVNPSNGTYTALVPQFIDPTPAQVADLRFRTALAVATDRQALVDSIANGLSPVPLSFLNPNQPQYAVLEATLPRYGYDVQRAGQLLTDMGSVRGPDGTLRDNTGTSLAVEVRSAAIGGAEANARAAAAIADGWQRIGVAATLAQVSPQLAGDREYQATFPGFLITPRPADVNGLRAYTSATVPLSSNNFTPFPGNVSRYRSVELDELIAQYFRTVPVDERVMVLGRVVHHMVDQLTLLGLYYGVGMAAESHRLSGVGPSGISRPSAGTLTNGMLPASCCTRRPIGGVRPRHPQGTLVLR